MDCSPPGSSFHGISQARILEWVAISSSRGSSRPRDQTWVSCDSRNSRRILYHWATWEATDLLQRPKSCDLKHPKADLILFTNRRVSARCGYSTNSWWNKNKCRETEALNLLNLCLWMGIITGKKIMIFQRPVEPLRLGLLWFSPRRELILIVTCFEFHEYQILS